ncbi:MAG: hypothetical protein H6518_09945 [Microthrixaceae bacterium]|nr:hypothetical protein [Microthrixaceae bacterium]
MAPTTRTAITSLLLASALALAAVGCGSDAESASDDTAATTTSAPTTSAPTTTDAGDTGTVVIEGSDYAFGNVPETVSVGTTLELDNTSDTELHELVAFRVDTDEPLDDLLALPQDELERQLGIPTAVLVQPPGAPEAFAAVGDGTLTEPGRYVLLCTIPQGADPEAYVAAAQAAQGGRPEGFDGAPHFTLGMAAEVTAE